MRAATRQPMYPKPWQRWAWAALPAASAAALAFVPFIVAWQRRVVGWRTLAVYVALSGILIAGAAADFDFRQYGRFWREVIRVAHWAYLLTAVVHVALLDRARRSKEAPTGYGAHFEQETTEKR